MAPNDVRIAIVGGGIGGLTAAICLLKKGFDVQVYEQSRLLSEVGAGINISPNASRILIQLGLGEECARLAYRSPFFHQRRWDDGRTLTKTRLAGDIVASMRALPDRQVRAAVVMHTELAAARIRARLLSGPPSGCARTARPSATRAKAPVEPTTMPAAT